MKPEDVLKCVTVAVQMIAEVQRSRNQRFVMVSLNIYKAQCVIRIKEDGLPEMNPRTYELYASPEECSPPVLDTRAD